MVFKKGYKQTEGQKKKIGKKTKEKWEDEEFKNNRRIEKLKEKNPNWKGDKVGYNALHNWIRRHKPKPKLCEECKKKKPDDLANISGEYKRDIDDFKWVCRGCHMKSDGRLKKLAQINKNKPKLFDKKKYHKKWEEENKNYHKKYYQEHKEKWKKTNRNI